MLPRRRRPPLRGRDCELAPRFRRMNRLRPIHRGEILREKFLAPWGYPPAPWPSNSRCHRHASPNWCASAAPSPRIPRYGSPVTSAPAPSSGWACKAPMISNWPPRNQGSRSKRKPPRGQRDQNVTQPSHIRARKGEIRHVCTGPDTLACRIQISLGPNPQFLNAKVGSSILLGSTNPPSTGWHPGRPGQASAGLVGALRLVCN